MTLVEPTAIAAAAGVVATTCLRTPMLPFGSEAGRAPLWLKAECLQPTGAFKLRGATVAVASLTDEQRARGVVTHSSGNHAQAVAFAAAAAGVRATVVMPEDAVAHKVEATRGRGAEVVLVPFAERESRCAEIAAATGAEIIPPYDDARVIAGQGTVGLEVLAQLPEVRVVLVPVSGGGLISGVAAAVKTARPDIAVIGVEPELAGDAAESLRTGSLVSWDVARTGRTIADGLRCTRIGDLNWEHVQAYVDDIVTVSEDAIMATVARIATRTRVVAEPSGAVAAAAWLEHPSAIPEGPTCAIVSGGNVDPALLARVLGG